MREIPVTAQILSVHSDTTGWFLRKETKHYYLVELTLVDHSFLKAVVQKSLGFEVSVPRKFRISVEADEINTYKPKMIGRMVMKVATPMEHDSGEPAISLVRMEFRHYRVKPYYKSTTL